VETAAGPLGPIFRSYRVRRQQTPLRRGGVILKIGIMELELIRTYHPLGTNGKILCSGCLLAYSIELPWKDNQAGVSCIPEGRYGLMKRWSPELGRHLQVMDDRGVQVFSFIRPMMR
jgi:hypothetical protein